MAYHVHLALIGELDTFTPCVKEQGNSKQQRNFDRLGHLVGKILRIGEEQFTKPQQEKLLEALRFSAEKHAGVYREDKIIPYFLHPLEAGCILIDLSIYDFKTLLATILHDVIEDTNTNLKEIRKRFGPTISKIVGLMTKHPDKKIKEQYWTMMKQESNLDCRWRVIVCKFTDRIHNAMTFKILTPTRRQKKIDETRREFPSLYEVLNITIKHLHNEGVIQNRHYLNIPYLLNGRLKYEMMGYT